MQRLFCIWAHGSPPKFFQPVQTRITDERNEEYNWLALITGRLIPQLPPQLCVCNYLKFILGLSECCACYGYLNVTCIKPTVTLEQEWPTAGCSLAALGLRTSFQIHCTVCTVNFIGPL